MSEAISLNDFASQLAQASEPEGQAQEAPSTDAEQPEQVEEATAEPEGQEVEQSADEPEGEEPAQDDGQAPAAPADEQVIKWTTASGESFEAPIKELKDGYLRQSDYTQKTQALAQEREKAQARLFEQFQMVEALGPDLGAHKALMDQIQQYQQLDWAQLKAEDPERHQAHVTQFLLLREQAKELGQSIQNRQAQFNQAQQQEAIAATQAASEHLKKAIPGFGDKHLAEMNSHMLSKGLKQDDLPLIVQKLGKALAPQVLEAIHEAAQWKALQAKKPEVENRVKAVPPKAVAKVSSAAKPTSQQEQIARIASSNKVMSAKDFASLLAQTRKGK